MLHRTEYRTIFVKHVPRKSFNFTKKKRILCRFKFVKHIILRNWMEPMGGGGGCQNVFITSKHLNILFIHNDLYCGSWTTLGTHKGLKFDIGLYVEDLQC